MKACSPAYFHPCQANLLKKDLTEFVADIIVDYATVTITTILMTIMNDFNQNNSLGYLISKANWYKKTYFAQRLKAHGFTITPEQWIVLLNALQQPGISQTELAARSSKDKTNITRILDVLERNEYLYRKDDEHDRRMYGIYLTAAGETLLQQLIPVAEEVNTISRQGISDEELSILKRGLQQICATLEELLH